MALARSRIRRQPARGSLVASAMRRGSHPLDVAFDSPRAGWIEMQLVAGTEAYSEVFSHIYPTLPDLCSALWEAGQRVSSRRVMFLLEPCELELRIDPTGEEESTLVIDFRHGRGNRARSRQVFACTTSTCALVVAFWRALRRLETSASPEEFQKEWREPFPSREMAALTKLVKQWSSVRR